MHVFLRRFTIVFLLVGVCRIGAMAQTTRELFSRPGLALGAYHVNYFDGTWSTSWRYAGDTLLCGESLLVFEHLANRSNPTLLYVDGGRVFQRDFTNPCAPGNLLYDFDLDVGQTFPVQGHWGTLDMTVTEKGTRMLLNGETRRYLRLALPNPPSPSLDWIEGIGDVERGLFPLFYDFEGYSTFVCARDASGDLWANPNENWKCDSLLCPVPITRFSATANDKTVVLSNQSRNGKSWFWEFGDGQTSTELHPVHEYADPGCYEVCLTTYTDCLQRGFRSCVTTPVCIDPTWTLLPTPPAVPTNEYISYIEFLTPDLGWVLARNSIWKTTDGGQTWEKQPHPQAPAPATRILQQIRMLNAQTGIIACGHYGANSAVKAILITNDGGQTWEERGDSTYFLSTALLTPDGQGFATRQFRGLYYSADGGTTWVNRKTPNLLEILWMQYMGNNLIYAFGFQGIQPQATPVFAKSPDAGLTWQITPMPDWPVQYDAHFFDTQTGWALGKAGELIRTNDGGQTWAPYPFGEMRAAKSIAFADAQHGWAVGDGGLVLHTTDGGVHWERENCGYPGNMRNLSAPTPDKAFANGFHQELLAFAPSAPPPCDLGTHAHAASHPTDLVLAPNPATSMLRVQLSGETPLQNADRLLVFNMLGIPVAQHTCSGSESERLDLSGLPIGYYALLVLRANQVVAKGRFVVVP